MKANGIEVAPKKRLLPIIAFAKINSSFSNCNFLLLAVLILFMVLMQVGVDQGYEPIQPIHYSHRIHAGDNELIVNIVTFG
jgi:energy-converting hydrogenase Eha subunit H